MAGKLPFFHNRIWCLCVFSSNSPSREVDEPAAAWQLNPKSPKGWYNSSINWPYRALILDPGLFRSLAELVRCPVSRALSPVSCVGCPDSSWMNVAGTQLPFALTCASEPVFIPSTLALNPLLLFLFFCSWPCCGVWFA